MLILLLTACLIPTSSVTIELDQCEVLITSDVDSVMPGESVTLGGGPFTEPFDTVVTVDGTSAAVSAIKREGCDECDLCRQVSQCNACEPCTSCDTACSTCNQTVEFTVPAIAPGDRSVVLVNHYATSNAVSLTVDSVEDTGDTGTSDTGDTDTSDTSTSDTGDSGTEDSGERR